jgi:hypothetical protein
MGLPALFRRRIGTLGPWEALEAARIRYWIGGVPVPETKLPNSSDVSHGPCSDVTPIAQITSGLDKGVDRISTQTALS